MNTLFVLQTPTPHFAGSVSALILSTFFNGITKCPEITTPHRVLQNFIEGGIILRRRGRKGLCQMMMAHL
jgi:hypothetical protein